MKLAVGRNQLIQAERSISSTRIGKSPNLRAAKGGLLRTPTDFSAARYRRIGRLAEKSDETRPIARDFSLELLRRSGQFGCRELICTRSRSRNERRQAVSKPQDRVVVRRQDLPGRKSCEINDPPEPVASPNEMMPCADGGNSRIDPAKNHRKIFGDDVREPIAHHLSPCPLGAGRQYPPSSVVAGVRKNPLAIGCSTACATDREAFRRSPLPFTRRERLGPTHTLI
jgi:hypothetical protein